MPDNPSQPDPTPPARPPGFARVEEIFFEVASHSPRDREDAIRRLCAGNTDLEKEVRSLVSAAGDLGAFLERPALGDNFDLAKESQHAAVDEMVGTTVGSFRVDRRIASGGMGTVYEASRADGQFEQKVAIKIVKRGMDSDEILRRFKAERQTLAALDHPNIARLIDGGVTDDGRPFLVMEYIDGRPIDEYCDEKRLSVRERLTMVQQVCAAVHHAHQNLIIHRDLKPSNILVTAQGVPKLLDFGIARLLGGGTDRHVTADTDRRLTPEYASPEQVLGESLSTSSDVYSLGVVLYELLTGVRPYYFGAKTQEEVWRVVVTEQPVPPSMAVTVRVGRLGTTRGSSSSVRPPSGQGTSAGASSATATGTQPGGTPVDQPRTRGITSTRLRGQLRGDLDNIVLMALRKEAHRRYGSAEQLAADIGNYLAGLPVLARRDTVGYRAGKFIKRHREGVGLTVAALLILSGATITLYRQSQMLQRQRDELIVSNNRLTENRRFLNGILAGGNARDKGPDARLGDVLRDTAEALENTPPKDTFTRAAAEYSLGQAMMSLGMLAQARPLLERAAAAYAPMAEDSEARLDIAVDLAVMDFYEGRHAAAETALRRLLVIEQARNAGVPTEREGTILTNIGAALRLQRRFDESLAVQADALRVRTVLQGAGSLAVAETLNNIASSRLQNGDVAGAITDYEQSLAVRRALLRPDHPLVVRCETNLGLALIRAGRAGEAVPMLTHAAESWDEAFSPHDATRIAPMTSLAIALRKQGDLDGASQWLESALQWQQANRPQDTANIAATQANIGLVRAQQGRTDEAVQLLEAALPTLRAAPNLAGITANAAEALANIYDSRGEAAKAEQTRRKPR